MKLEIHHYFHAEDQTLLQIQSQLTAIMESQKEILRKMANQEQDLQAILGAVKTVKSSLDTANQQLASANERIAGLEGMLSDDTNQNIVDEIAELKSELGLATEAVEEAVTAVENAGGGEEGETASGTETSSDEETEEPS